MNELATIKTTSHRSRDRLNRVTTPGREHYRWTARGADSGYYRVPTADLDAILAIKGIREIKRPLDLHPCITF